MDFEKFRRAKIFVSLASVKHLFIWFDFCFLSFSMYHNKTDRNYYLRRGILALFLYTSNGRKIYPLYVQTIFPKEETQKRSRKEKTECPIKRGCWLLKEKNYALNSFSLILNVSASPRCHVGACYLLSISDYFVPFYIAVVFCLNSFHVVNVVL